MEFLHFLGWMLLFSVVLVLALLILGEMSILIAAAAILAFLRILFQRLDRVERKLDKLQNERKEE